MELWRFLLVEEKAEPEWELQIQFQHVAEHSYPVVQAARRIRKQW